MIRRWFLDPRNRVLVIALVLMAIVIAGVNLAAPRVAEDTTPEASADTYIPEGFVLVPIELQNADSLSSLIGEFALVDLFRGPRSHRVGKRLKLLRAPLNPNQFAVLVPEEQVSELLQTPGPFWAAIQNPQLKKSTEIGKRHQKSRIEYFEGSGT